jgi:hypothetical protein
MRVMPSFFAMMPERMASIPQSAFANEEALAQFLKA